MNTDTNRQQLEREAESARNHLAMALRALDRRRHDAFDMGLQVRRNVAPFAVTTAAVALVAATWIALAVRRYVAREHHRGRERARAIERFWHRPERVAISAPRRTIFGEIGRGVMISVATFVVSGLVRYALKRVTVL